MRRNWWTTISGSLMVAMGAWKAIQAPETIGQGTLALVCGGIGLIKAKDGNACQPEESVAGEVKEAIKRDADLRSRIRSVTK